MKETWKQIPGYEGYYEVSTIGRVRTDTEAKTKSWHFHAGKILKQHLVDRYLRVWLCRPIKRFKFVHSVVLETFVGPRPKGLVSRHLDGNVFNNAVENLTWGTQQENIHDKQRHGTQTRGESHGTSKVSIADVIAIRKLREDGLTLRAISCQFPISCDAIHSIVRRRTWTHI